MIDALFTVLCSRPWVCALLGSARGRVSAFGEAYSGYANLQSLKRT
jgi:hypothetical protein